MTLQIIDVSLRARRDSICILTLKSVFAHCVKRQLMYFYGIIKTGYERNIGVLMTISILSSFDVLYNDEGTNILVYFLP